MERRFKEKGVFLLSRNLDSTLLLKCLQSLLSHYPTLKFTSITTDENLGGFKVLFSGPEVTAVLEKKQLRVDDDVVGIYPLTTVLSIYDVGAFENPLLEDDVIEAISEKYGKVFEVIKFDSEAALNALSRKLENSLDTSKLESLFEKKWRVRIDLPEFEGNEVFGSETEKFIFLPKWDKSLKVTFWCRCCKMCGHFQHSCPKKLQPIVAVGTNNALNGKSNYSDENKSSPTIHVESVSSLESEVPFENFDETFSPETTNSFVDTTERTPKATARKTFRSSEENNQNYKRMKTNESACDVISDQNKNLRISLKNIKKEIIEEDDDNTYKKEAQNRECEQSDNTDNENQSDAETDVRRYMSYEEETKLCIDTTSNDASDFTGKASEGKSDENSNSTFADEKEKVLPPRTSTPSGPSHTVTATSSSILGAADTSILSDELQGYINHACETIGALDRQTLDAFLGYVKKKNKPTQIALKYTPNVKQLKDQLQMILTLRYHTKPTNQVKEDAVFIKWLEGLVSRFDNTKPSKRKKPGQDY